MILVLIVIILIMLIVIILTMMYICGFWLAIGGGDGAVGNRALTMVNKRCMS